MVNLIFAIVALNLNAFGSTVNLSDYKCASWHTAQGQRWRILQKDEDKDVPRSHMTSLGFGSEDDCQKSLRVAEASNSDIVCAPTMDLKGAAPVYSLFDLFSGKKLAPQDVMFKKECDELATHSSQTFFCHPEKGTYKLSDARKQESDLSFNSKADCFAAIENRRKVNPESKHGPLPAAGARK